jgi:hypothetical protein
MPANMGTLLSIHGGIRMSLVLATFLRHWLEVARSMVTEPPAALFVWNIEL